MHKYINFKSNNKLTLLHIFYLIFQTVISNIFELYVFMRKREREERGEREEENAYNCCKKICILLFTQYDITCNILLNKTLIICINV